MSQQQQRKGDGRQDGRIDSPPCKRSLCLCTACLILAASSGGLCAALGFRTRTRWLRLLRLQASLGAMRSACQSLLACHPAGLDFLLVDGNRWGVGGWDGGGWGWMGWGGGGGWVGGGISGKLRVPTRQADVIDSSTRSPHTGGGVVYACMPLEVGRMVVGLGRAGAGGGGKEGILTDSTALGCVLALPPPPRKPHTRPC